MSLLLDINNLDQIQYIQNVHKFIILLYTYDTFLQQSLFIYFYFLKQKNKQKN